MFAERSIFHNEQAAYDFVEHHMWPQGPQCPRCHTLARSGKLAGATTRIGTYKCYSCYKPYTVKIGTVFENSHLPLHVWLKAIFLISTGNEHSHNIFRHLFEITPKTAVAMFERLEELTRPPVLRVRCDRQSPSTMRMEADNDGSLQTLQLPRTTAAERRSQKFIGATKAFGRNDAERRFERNLAQLLKLRKKSSARQKSVGATLLSGGLSEVSRNFSADADGIQQPL